MNIIITAGGTSERIDDVRVITNNSTGRLAREVAKAFLEKGGGQLQTIYYLHGKNAVTLRHEKIVNVPITGAEDLLAQLTELMQKKEIDAVIHAMAVSDYTVNYVLACDESGEHRVETGKKISSDIEEMKIVLKKTPKVIGEIKNLKDDVILVGFKLLSKVTREELIRVAAALLEKNRCDFVMANDISEITESAHRGYLVAPDGSYVTMETKTEIGETIAEQVIKLIPKKY